MNNTLKDITLSHDKQEFLAHWSVTETRQEYLIRTGRAIPRFLQGVYPFAGRGVFELTPLDAALSYRVPEGKALYVIYFRAGNLSDDLVYLTVNANGTPLRYFPIGPKADLHVPLAIVEPHPAGSHLEIAIAAPRGLNGTVVLDVGLLEADADAVGAGHP